MGGTLVQILTEARDGAAFARSVAAFKDHRDPRAGVARPCLQLDQFDLEPIHLAVILLAPQTFGMGVAVAQDIVLVGAFDRLVDGRGRVVFEIGADRTVKGQVHGGLLKYPVHPNLWSVLPPSANPHVSLRGQWRR